MLDIVSEIQFAVRDNTQQHHLCGQFDANTIESYGFLIDLLQPSRCQ